LKLTYEEALPDYHFNFNLRHYLKEACVKFTSRHVEAVTESEGWVHLMRAAPVLATQVLRAAAGLRNSEVGRCTCLRAR
jgi:hypothetical protein